jgi:hypothetical protein
MKLSLAILLLFVWPASVLAQNAGGPPVAFAPVTDIPIPLQSTSGRFSSLNPSNQINCGYSGEMVGRVVSAHLMMVNVTGGFCHVAEVASALVNVVLSNPTDAFQMVPGRRVVITARFRHAQESRTSRFYAEYLIAEKAELVAGDPRAAPAPAFMSYMVCQAPELDALAAKLGKDLCAQSTIVANLAATGPALEAAARTPGDVAPGDSVPGDADAITCRTDPRISDRHLPAVACARGRYWAWYNAKWHDPFLPQTAPP